MRQTKEDFRKMSIPDLHDEIMNLSGGDMWEGMMTTAHKKEFNAAEEVWEEKMVEFKKSPILIEDNEPKQIGKLSVKIGEVGRIAAEIGDPVYEEGDKYLIYLDDGKHRVSYYKETLKPVIIFA